MYITELRRLCYIEYAFKSKRTKPAPEVLLMITLSHSVRDVFYAASRCVNCQRYKIFVLFQKVLCKKFKILFLQILVMNLIKGYEGECELTPVVDYLKSGRGNRIIAIAGNDCFQVRNIFLFIVNKAFFKVNDAVWQ